MLLKQYNYTDLKPEEIEIICSDRFNKTLHSRVKRDEVLSILQTVKEKKDQALFDYSAKWDQKNLSSLQIQKPELEKIAGHLGVREKEAIHLAYKNIYTFHQAQKQEFKRIETMPGIFCWKEARPIESVGLYIPGGSAPLLSTFLMLGIPARIAGVKKIQVCTPAQKEGSLVHPAIAYIAKLLQIESIITVGGAQAIAALAYGTETISKVDKIFGPGNTYVTLAKQLVQLESQTAIDMPAGPSEVLIICDENSNPDFVASDLLAQAEHGPDSQVVVIYTSASWIFQLEVSLKKLMDNLPRKAIVEISLKNSIALKVDHLDQAFSFSNQYAPEHLIISFENYLPFLEKIQTAGSVFLGSFAPESAGDYASGTNHTLPTSGFAKMYSGVSVDSFCKMISFQSISESGLRLIGSAVETLASLEGLDAHAQSISIRLKDKMN